MSVVEERLITVVSIDAAVKERVERGIALLREKHGRNWAEGIDVATLELASCNSCVLGQLYGEYTVGLEKVGLADSANGGREHGFCSTPDSGGYAHLNQVWALEIAYYKGEPIELVGV